MSSQSIDLTLHTALLLLREIACEADVDAMDANILREQVARSAMELTHEERQRAQRVVDELLEQYNLAIGGEFYDEEGDGYEREPILYDERIDQVWRDGVRQRKSVRMHYRSEKSETTERIVDPWMTSTPYGVGWCHLREASRRFRFDRVAHIELTVQSFEKPEDWKAMM